MNRMIWTLGNLIQFLFLIHYFKYSSSSSLIILFYFDRINYFDQRLQKNYRKMYWPYFVGWLVGFTIGLIDQSVILWLRLFKNFSIRLIFGKHLIDPRKSDFFSEEWINVLKQHFNVHLFATIIDNLQKFLSINDSVLIPISFFEDSQKVLKFLLVHLDIIVQNSIFQPVLRDFHWSWILLPKFGHNHVDGISLVSAV